MNRRDAAQQSLFPTPNTYNRKVGLLLACPITNQRKQYPFEVVLPDGLPIAGVILADQVRSLDWRSRTAVFIARLGDEALAETLGKLATLIEDEKPDVDLP